MKVVLFRSVVASMCSLCLLLVCLLLVLTACSRPDDSRTKVLETRVAKLEGQIAALQQAMKQAQQGDAADSSSQEATARAAAQYCATQLASSLEEYRQDNARYPAASAVSLPSACQGFRVAWNTLEKTHYRFQVSGQSGGMLASEVR